MSTRYIVLSRKNGIAKVEHKCWFCKRKHTLCYPIDDVGMKTKSKQLCNKCDGELEKFKKNNPELC